MTARGALAAAVIEASHRLRLRLRSRRAGRERTTRGVIVTLTTTPGRLPASETAIASLLTQSVQPERVVLWLDEAVSDDPLPAPFERLMRAGLEVRYVQDVGPHTKLIPALQAFPDSILITADDDMLYPSRWLEELLGSYRGAEGIIHCHRGHLMRSSADGTLLPYQSWDLGAPGFVGPSSLLFPTGVGGVLYPPRCLDDEVFNTAAARRLCPTADDVWFKAMALLKRTAARKVAAESPRYRQVRAMAPVALYRENLTRNDEQIRATFEAYDLYRLLERGSSG